MAPQVGNSTNQEATFWNGSSYQTVVPESDGKYYIENGQRIPIPDYLLAFGNTYEDIAKDAEAWRKKLQAKYDEYQKKKGVCELIDEKIEEARTSWKKFLANASENRKNAQSHFSAFFTNITGNENVLKLHGYDRFLANIELDKVNKYRSKEDNAKKVIYRLRTDEIGNDADFLSYCSSQRDLCYDMRSYLV